MAPELSADTVKRIAELAKRLGYGGPKAQEQVLKIALDDLDAKTPPARPKLTPEDKRKELEKLNKLSEIGRSWRERHPDQYDENNPPSKAWQDELYDENGLPK